MKLVLDTNVVLAGLLSRRGASNWLLRRMLERRYAVAVSVPLFMEYEAVIKRAEHLRRIRWAPRDVDVFLDGVAAVIEPTSVRFLWRPGSVDPEDEMVVECAASSRADGLVTLNVRHMASAARDFGFRLLTPRQAMAGLIRRGVER